MHLPLEAGRTRASLDMGSGREKGADQENTKIRVGQEEVDREGVAVAAATAEVARE